MITKTSVTDPIRITEINHPDHTDDIVPSSLLAMTPALDNHKVGFVAATQPIDTSTSTGKLLLGASASTAIPRGALNSPCPSPDPPTELGVYGKLLDRAGQSHVQGIEEHHY